MTSDRMGISFAQAEGVEALPSQLALGTISPQLSAAMWATVYSSLDECIVQSSSVYSELIIKDPWKKILRFWWIAKAHRNIDEFPEPDALMRQIKMIMTSRDYVKVFDFIQFIIQMPECPRSFKNTFDTVLKFGRAAYRIVDDHILPISSEAEIAAVTAAILVARGAEARGPETHLKAAAVNLSKGDWGEAVRESIHAVESAAKSIEPTAATLGPALTKLQSSIALNPAVAKAYGALYGYTSDLKGIRHALVFESQTSVNERDAIFMYGACASFVSFLLSAKRSIAD